MRKTDMFKHLSVCIIDDIPIDAKIIIETLKIMGIREYVYYSNIREAIKELGKFYSIRLPDLILSEWYDDFIDTTFIELYKSSCIKNIPIVILTYDNQPSNHYEARKAFLADFIPKPIMYENLLSVFMKKFKRKFK